MRQQHRAERRERVRVACSRPEYTRGEASTTRATTACDKCSTPPARPTGTCEPVTSRRTPARHETRTPGTGSSSRGTAEARLPPQYPRYSLAASSATPSTSSVNSHSGALNSASTTIGIRMTAVRTRFTRGVRCRCPVRRSGARASGRPRWPPATACRESRATAFR